MLRSLFLHLSSAGWARRLASGRRARRAAARFVAGDTLDQAIAAVRRINAAGLSATLDHLGENVTDRAEAEAARVDYLMLIDRLAETDLQAHPSLKLTQLGLRLDPSFCLENLRLIARQAAGRDAFLGIDMEDSSAVKPTLSICGQLRSEGFQNVGTVIQSYLYRSEADLRVLLQQGIHVRLVKGAYQEPASVAFPRKQDVDANFDRLCRVLLEHTRDCPAPAGTPQGRVPALAAIATHDEARIAFARRCAEELGLPRNAFEFQMLFGIREDLQRSLADDGYPVRVYVPYGTEWFPYYMRRLAERPANVIFVLRNVIRP